MQSKHLTLKHEFVAPDIIKFTGVLTPEEIDYVLGLYKGKSFEMDLAHNPYYDTLESRPEIAFLEPQCEGTKLLNGKCKSVVDKMVELYGNVGVKGGSPFRYNEYAVGRGYKRHVDRSNNAPHLKDREISVIFGLNDTYEGGLLHFPRQEVQIKIGLGECVVFPSSYTHPHEVLPVTSGIRKTIVTWLS